MMALTAFRPLDCSTMCWLWPHAGSTSSWSRPLYDLLILRPRAGLGPTLVRHHYGPGHARLNGLIIRPSALGPAGCPSRPLRASRSSQTAGTPGYAVQASTPGKAPRSYAPERLRWIRSLHMSVPGTPSRLRPRARLRDPTPQSGHDGSGPSTCRSRVRRPVL